MEIISISNFIIIGIVLLILFIYRQLDKNNRSLEKVKKYSDKVKEGLSAFIDQKTADFRNCDIEVQVNLKTAKEALKRFKEEVEKVNGYSTGMAVIEKKFSDYERVLKELEQSAHAIEENLKRVEQESRFIDKVDKDVKLVRDNLTKLEKNIPAIYDNFDKHNKESLSALKDGIVKDVSSEHSKVLAQVSQADKQVKDFAAFISRLESKSQAMEQETLKNLKKVSGEYEAHLLANKGQLESLTKIRIDEILKIYKETKEKFEEEVLVVEAGYTSRLATAAQKGQALESEVLKNLTDIIEDNTNRFNARIKTTFDSLNQAVSDKTTDILSAINTTKEDVSIFSANINGEMENLEKSFNVRFEKASQTMDFKVQNAINSLNNTVDVKINDLLSVINSAKADADNLTSTVNSEIGIISKSFEQKIETAKQEMESKAVSTFNTLDNTISTKSVQLLSIIDGTKDQVAAYSVQINGELVDLKKSFNDKFEQTSQTMDASLKSVAHTLDNSISTKVDSLLGIIKNAKEDADSFSLHIADEITRMEKNFSLKFEEASQSMDVKVSTSIQSMNSTVDQKVNAMLAVVNEARGEVDRFSGNVNGEISVMEKSFMDKLAACSRELDQRMGITVDSLSANVEKNIGNVMCTVNETKSEVDLFFNNIQNEMEDIGKSFSKELEAVKQDMDIKLENTIEDLKENVDTKISGLLASVNTANDDLTSFTGSMNAQLANMENSFTGKLETTRQQMSGKVDSNFAALNKTITDQVNDLLKTVNVTKDHVSHLSVTIDGEINIIEKSFNEKFEGLKQDINSQIEIFVINNREKQKSLAEELLNLNILSEKRIEKQKLDLTKSLEEMATDLNGFKNLYSEKIRDAALNGEVEREKMIKIITSNIEGSRLQFTKELNNIDQEIAGVEAVRVNFEKRMKDVKNEFDTSVKGIYQDINEFKEQVENSIEVHSNEIEGRVLSGIEGRLAEFEALSLEKIKKIEECNLDIENITVQFNNLLEMKKSDVSANFNQYVLDMDQTRRQEDAKTRDLILKLDSEMKQLETGLVDLKTKAYANVSEKLKVFEDEFFSDLKKRSRLMETGMTDWQKGVETEIDKIKQKHIAERQQMENTYTAYLEDKLSQVKTKSEEAVAKLKEFVKEENNGVKNYADKLSSNVEKVCAEIKARYLKMKETTDADKKLVDSTIHNIKQEITGMKEEFSDHIRKIEEDNTAERRNMEILYNKEFQHRIKQLTDIANKEIQEVSSSFLIKKGDVIQEINSLKINIEKIKNDLNLEINKQTKDSLKIFNDEIILLNSHTKAALIELGKQADDSLKAFNDEIINIKSGNQGRLKELHSVIASDMDEVKNFAADLAKVSEKQCISIENRLKDVNSKVDTHQVSIKELIAASEEKTRIKQDEITGRFNSYSYEFDEKVNEFKKQITGEIDAITDDFAKQRQDLIITTNEERSRIKNELKDFSLQLTDFNTNLKTRSKEAIKEFSIEYNTFKNEYLDKINVFRDDVDKHLSVFKTTMDGNNLSINDSFNKNMKTFDTGYKTISERLKVLEKQQDNFIEQTKVFERADKLKIFLKTSIDELKESIARIEPEKQKVFEAEAELSRARKSVDEIGVKVTRFFAEKRRVDKLEKDFTQLIKISEDVEFKIEQISSNQDVLQSLQLKLKELDKLGNEVNQKYERLAKKESLVETTTKEIDKNFQALMDVEKHIKSIEDNYKVLPSRIEEIKHDMKVLLDNKPRAEKVIEHLEKLTTLLSDIETRMDKLQTAREWLSKTETRLQSINKEVNDQVKLMKSLVRAEAETVGGGDRGAPSADKRQTILKLSNQGWSVKEIARATNTSQGEVELILELAPQKR